MNNEYKPHFLEWTDEKVARFWNFRNNYRPYDDTWFTKSSGAAILKYVNKHTAIKGKVLDYGTGKGFLLDHLLNMKVPIELYACDFTDTVAEQTQLHYKNREGFKGCTLITGLPSAYPENYFDMVFLIETIEHLTDNYLHGTFIEINRILKPGGVIIVTTPNEEALEPVHVHCADCGATFHHMQHIRAWSVPVLTNLAQKFKFSTVLCKGINLQWYNKRGFLYFAADKMKQFFGKKNNPNLIYIGRKK